jgi:sulfur carrier protein
VTAVTLNGERRELPDGATVAAALEAVDAPPEGVAVAVDGEVVPRGEWSATPLDEGQQVEVLHAVQGG